MVWLSQAEPAQQYNHYLLQTAVSLCTFKVSIELFYVDSSIEDIVKILFTVLSWFAMLWESQLRLKEMLQDETNLEFIWNGGQL